MGDVDLKFDKFVENYNLDMKILLTKLDSMFPSQIHNKPTNQIEYDISNNNNANRVESKLEFSSDDSIEKNLLIDRMLEDNFCLLNKNLTTTNSASIINNNNKNIVNSNLKSILIKSSSVHNSDNTNICPEAYLREKLKTEKNSQINLKQKVGIKKQLTFGEDMSSGNAKRKILDDIRDNLSLNLTKIDLPYKSEILIRSIESKESDTVVDNNSNNTIDHDINNKLIAESENSSIHDIDDDIDDYSDKIYSNILLKEENEQEEKILLKLKYKNDLNKNTDL